MNKAINELLKSIQECGCGVGGVTTSSFAPAVTNTIYPRPKKKKSKFRKKTEELLKELTKEELDKLYDDRDEPDPSEQTWADWSNYDNEEYNKNKQAIEDQTKKKKEDFCNKYQQRNQEYLKKLDDLFEKYVVDPTVSPIALKTLYYKNKKQIINAEKDLQRYREMPAEEFVKLQKPIRMKPININIEYWRIKKIDPIEYNN